MLSPGQQVASWIVEDLVSMGVPRTFRARHASVGTEALLEVMPQSKATIEGQQREVEALRKVHHRNVAEVIDYGVDHERELVWTAFRWFEGEPLQDVLLQGTPRWERACAVLRDVAAAVVQVHAVGLVHRDLRPANVVVGPRSAWVVGFDFALTQQELEALSQAPFGDLAYLAPEVLRDPTHHGAKADVYAFGCVAYELLTGKPAFPAAAWGERPDQALKMLEWKARTAALDPGTGVPDWLRSLVQKCTDPSPDRRLPDLESLVGWLDAARGSWEPHAFAGPVPVIDVDAPPAEEEQATIHSEAPRPVPVVRPSLVPAPTLVPRPSLRDAVPRPPPVVLAPSPPPPGMPPTAQYFVAAIAGVASALGFSAIVILFVELSNGTL